MRLTSKHKKELKALSEVRFKHLSLPELKKIAPKAGKYMQRKVDALAKGRISFDEASGIFSYYTGEIAEVVYGNEGYEFFNYVVGLNE